MARELDARYAMTYDHDGLRPGSLEERLHRRDGAAGEGSPRLAHFRLVAEGPVFGRPLVASFPDGPPAHRVVPYKLFEIVEGARLEVAARPGDAVLASVELETSLGRRFVHRIETRAGDDGVARARLPYPTERGEAAGRGRGRAATRATGPWEVRVGASGAEIALEVSEEAVRSGAVVRPARAAPAP